MFSGQQSMCQTGYLGAPSPPLLAPEKAVRSFTERYFCDMRLGEEPTESSCGEGLMDPCGRKAGHEPVQKANPVLGCMQRTMAKRSREGILPVCSRESPPGALHPAPVSSAQERCYPGRAAPEESPKMLRELEDLCTSG